MRTALFDLDGTLVDSVPDLAAALNRLLAARGLAPFTRPEVASMVGDGAAALVAKALAARGQATDAAATEAYVADYTAHAIDESRPFPGVVDTLTALRADGWTLAVCTNKPEAATRAVLDGLQLARYFTAIGGGDSFATRKPDAGHLLGTLARAGGTMASAVMIGDHHNDVAAATAAAIPAVFAAWGYGPREAGATAAAIAERASELPSIMARLVG